DGRGEGESEACVDDDDVGWEGFAIEGGQLLGTAAVDPMSQVLQRFGGEGMIEAGRGADVQNPHVLHPPPRRPTSESEYSEVRVVRALSAAGAKWRRRDQMRHDSAVIRWIRVAVALVLVLALSASVYWGYTLFLLATGLIVLGVAYGWPRLTDSPQPRATSIMLALFGVAGLVAAWRDSAAPYLDWLPVL